jgi:hypothetical protein
MNTNSARFPDRLLSSLLLCLLICSATVADCLAVVARPRESLSDEDILNPKKLIFNKVVPFIDSFDGSTVGTVFVSKRAMIGHPKYGPLGESSAASFPLGADEIDASYVYLFQKKGECIIGVRGIGWGEKLEKYVNGEKVEIGRVRHQSTKTNITQISINGVRVGPPTNQAQLNSPNGTNYKYYPQRQNSIGKSVGSIVGNIFSGVLARLLSGSTSSSSNNEALESYSSTNEGYITDIHYFPASELVRRARLGEDLVIEMPAWLPTRHLITGAPLTEIRKLANTCETE